MATSQELQATEEQLHKYEDFSDNLNQDFEDGKKHKSHHHGFFHFHKKHDKHKHEEKHHHENGHNENNHVKDAEIISNEDKNQDGQTQDENTSSDEHHKEKDEHHEEKEKYHPNFHGLGFKPMANCLDFRTRTVSFDLHNIGHTAKMSLLSKLLHRSKSESSMKVPPKSKDKEKDGGGSPSGQSPKQSPGATPRRRFVRVVRDDQCVGEEYVNPHVTRRFSKNHWERNFLKKSASLDEGDETCRPLPYTVTGHTILKKHHSVDCEALCADVNKHAKFNEQVEVLEYDIKGKILAIHSDASILHAKLHDGEIIHNEVVLSRDACDAISIGEVEVELPIPSCVTLDVIDEATTPTDLTPDSDATDTTVLTEGMTTADADSDSDVEDLVSDSVFDEPSDSEHAPKTSRQISAEDECTVKKSKIEGGQVAKSIDSVCKEKLKEVES